MSDTIKALTETFCDFDDATAVLECYRSFIDQAPEQLGCFFGWQIAPRLAFIPEDRVGDLFCVLVTCWNGPHEEAEQVLRPPRDVAKGKAELVEVMPFPALQSASDDFRPERDAELQPFIPTRTAPGATLTSCPATTRTVPPRTPAPTTSGCPP